VTNRGKIAGMKTTRSVLAILLFMLSLASTQQASAAEDKDDREVAAFRLNMDKVNRFATASKGLVQYRKEHKDSDDSDQDSQTLDAMVSKMNAHPALVKIIQDARMTPREYALTTLTLVTTGIAVSMKKQGVLKEYPASVSRENAAFIEQNYAKIESLLKGLQESQN
jgi:hypothetical protein